MSKFEMVEVKDAGGQQIHLMIKVDGHRIATFNKPPEEIADIVHDLVNLPIRSDDVMFCSPPKAGTHWVFEILSMLLSGKVETIPHSKGKLMLEVIPQSQLMDCSSPRVLNSHLPLHMLPKEIKEKRIKVVLVLRNPKDTCVSFYNHHKGIRYYGYDGEFGDYMPLFLNGQLDYGDWFDYVLQMEEEMRKGEYNIHLVYYEDLKENGSEEIQRLAKFLGVPASDDICKAICNKCDFQNMAKDKAYNPEEVKQIFKGGFKMYRKGQIGDWKNYFTVSMSEQFDKIYQSRMKNSKLKFRFSPSNI